MLKRNKKNNKLPIDRPMNQGRHWFFLYADTGISQSLLLTGSTPLLLFLVSDAVAQSPKARAQSSPAVLCHLNINMLKLHTTVKECHYTCMYLQFAHLRHANWLCVQEKTIAHNHNKKA